ncbi:serine hydrolase, partial [Reichenbachiella sp.]
MKILKWIVVATLFCGFVAGVLTYYPKLVIMSGYSAKVACSCTFIGGLDEETIYNKELNFAPANLVKFKVDRINQTVTASVFGLQKKVAVYREGLGCALLTDLGPKDAFREKIQPHQPKHDSLVNWFDHRVNPTSEALSNAINKAFEEKDPSNSTKNTRAVLVLHKGNIIGEQYAPEVDQNTPLLGWSMTKSLTSTLFGMLVDRDIVHIDAETDIPAWENDRRANITWKHLLQMNSGLR